MGWRSSQVVHVSVTLVLAARCCTGYTRWGPVRSSVELLKAGDFEHLARCFEGGCLALELPGRSTRCVVIHETETALVREVVGSRCLADRVGGFFPEGS